METETADTKGWERTNVTNLLRSGKTGIYYGRVKHNGKQRWKSLKTAVLSVAKLRIADFEREIRAQGVAEKSPTGSENETDVARFIAIFQERTGKDSTLAPATKTRRQIAVKALLKTWPALPSRDARRVTATEAQQWAAKALREGTGFIAPNAKKVSGKGMSPSAFNHCHEALKAIFAIAIEQGAAYANPAESVSRAKIKKKPLELPTMAQFHTIVQHISEAGARQSKDCADLTRFLAFSGVRIAEAGILRWQHVDEANGRLTIPGTKSETSHRIVPLFPALKSLLVEIRSRHLAAGVEQSVEAPILKVKECTRALRSACKKAGVKNLSHHDLRHLFATTCIESGVDIPTVSRWLGHSDGGALAMRTYGHLRDQHSQAQAAKVDFGGAS